VADDSAPLDTEGLLRRLVEIVNNAKTLPMSNTVRLTRDEIIDLLSDALDRLPEEFRQARWMLKDRAEFLAKTQREAADILEQARVRAEQMVQRSEIVREAAHTAQRLVTEANEESSRLRLEAEDYCDQRLASFEIVLERTIKTVQAGREKLRVAPLPDGERLGLGDESAPGAGTPASAEEAFFDQDIV
jgi:F0F1-type ATP synthase membrane subunit b/b'